MNDRIKLAEAMGRSTEILHKWSGESESVFDPWADANDDYAVLEWMRCKCKLGSITNDEPTNWKLWDSFCCELLEPELRGIGDYARAALKVME